MKKAYTAPKAEAIDFYMEGAVALTVMSNPNDPTITDDTEILSNKKENFYYFYIPLPLIG